MGAGKSGVFAILLFGSLLAFVSCVRSQFDAGPFMGVVGSGRRDIKIWEDLHAPEQQTVSPSAGLLVGGAFRMWHTAGCPGLGAGAELDYWETTLKADSFKIEQENFMLLGSILVRCPIAAAAQKNVFVYGGPVGGAVLAKTNGHSEFGPAVGLLAGFEFPLAARLRLGIEAAGVCARDANGGLASGARAKISGSSASLAQGVVGPHGDACSLFARLRLAIPF